MPTHPPSRRELKNLKEADRAYQRLYSSVHSLSLADEGAFRFFQLLKPEALLEMMKLPRTPIQEEDWEQYQADRRRVIANLTELAPTLCRLYPQHRISKAILNNGILTSQLLHKIIDPGEKKPKINQATGCITSLMKCLKCCTPIGQHEGQREQIREEKRKQQKWKMRRILMSLKHANRHCDLYKNICNEIRLYNKPFFPFRRNHIRESIWLLQDLKEIYVVHLVENRLVHELEKRINKEIEQLKVPGEDEHSKIQGEYSKILGNCLQKIIKYKKKHNINTENDMQTLLDMFMSLGNG